MADEEKPQEYQKCFGKLNRRRDSSHDEIKRKCTEERIPYNSVRKQLGKGLSLDEAMEYVRTHRRSPKGTRITRPSKTGERRPESFHEYFVDTFRLALGKDPIYNRKT